MNWQALKELRELFLQSDKNHPNYWKSKELLSLYDQTFATRIGWKWDSVLTEVKTKLHLPQNYQIIDWGAGTAVATRKFLGHFATNPPQKIILVERSTLALEFAKEKITELAPTIEVSTFKELTNMPTNSVLLLSHVLTEISESQIAAIVRSARHAQAVIWVEPGAKEPSRKLSQIRESLLDAFTVLSPCTHQNTCPLFKSTHEKDWCHQFATVPTEAFTSSHWKTFSKELGIDLRSLPTSFLALQKSPIILARKSRLIGRARHYKGYSLVQLCKEDGIEERKLLVKTDKELIKELKDEPFSYLLD